MAGQLRVVAYGGGVQSTSLLVLAATGRINFRTFLFANTGADSEDPATLEYLHRYAKPYAAAHDIDLHELRRTRRDGSIETLYGRLTRDGSRSLPIPVRMSNGAPGTRSCTTDFKIRVMGRWLKAHGVSAETPAVVGIGISLDEIERVNNRRAMPYEQPTYPLLEQAPPLRRHDCERVITASGLPIPPKSACWFAPSSPDLAGPRCVATGHSCSIARATWKLYSTPGGKPSDAIRFGSPATTARFVKPSRSRKTPSPGSTR